MVEGSLSSETASYLYGLEGSLSSMEEDSLQCMHGKAIIEKESWREEASGRHLRRIWEASERHLRGI